MWYILKVNAGGEEVVIQNIKKAMSKDPVMNENILSMHSPTHNVTTISSKRQAVTKKKSFFSGYIMIEANLDDVLVNRIISVPGVNGFIASKDGAPRVVRSKEDVDNFINVKSRLGDNVDTFKVCYQIGQQVKILCGPFESFYGIVESINYEKKSLFVSVTIFSRPTPVELSWDHVAVESENK